LAIFGNKLGLFLKPWIERSEVETLVIGGNISNAFDLFGKNMSDYFIKNGVKVCIEVSELRETASIIGSSTLAENNYYEQLKPLLATM
jgi:glucokinase